MDGCCIFQCINIEYIFFLLINYSRLKKILLFLCTTLLPLCVCQVCQLCSFCWLASLPVCQLHSLLVLVCLVSWVLGLPVGTLVRWFAGCPPAQSIFFTGRYFPHHWNVSSMMTMTSP